MEYMEHGSLTEILDLYPTIQMTEPQMAAVCQAVGYCYAFFIDSC
jgi:hypothetical protein